MTEEKIPLPEENFFAAHKNYLILLGLGVFLILVGVRVLFYFKKAEPTVTFISEASSSAVFPTQITVEVAGAVVKPGVYTLTTENRIQDLLLAAGGLGTTADRSWVAKGINLASKLSDGAKVYIPAVGEVEGESSINKVKAVGGETFISKSIININTASETQLDSLPGVGKVTTEKILAGRPYQSIEELVEKKIVNKGTFEKIKDKVSVY